MSSSHPLEPLTGARQIAAHAIRLGIVVNASTARPAANHLGAVVADAVLQAGLNYRTVVKPRVDRIQANYPQAAKLSGLEAIVEGRMVSEFLLWTHVTKISRFTQLVGLLRQYAINGTSDLRQWLTPESTRNVLLAVQGVGPKTYDYLCCLVGIDRIAVDRHVRMFAKQAGVLSNDYDELQVVVSFAADLLGLARRDFDAWIWRQQAAKASEAYQHEMF